mgnify:CR=1 FL=1
MSKECSLALQVKTNEKAKARERPNKKMYAKSQNLTFAAVKPKGDINFVAVTSIKAFFHALH